MTEREQKARVFPQGWDWGWISFYGLMILICGWAGDIGALILQIIFLALVLFLRRAMRIADAQLADAEEAMHEAWKNLEKELNKTIDDIDKHIKAKEKTDGRNKSRRVESSSKEPSKRP